MKFEVIFNIRLLKWLICFLPLVQLSAQDDINKSDTIFNLGYISQNRKAMAGSISTVDGKELETSPVGNLFQTMAGRFSGLIIQETNGELFNENVLSYVRGVSTINGQVPLYILDGVICSGASVQYITPQVIESISVLKDASLTAIYGIQGSNGVIVINTKRGKIGDFKITTTFDQSFQQMTRSPYSVNSKEYATLRNQAWKNDGSIGKVPFSQEEITAYGDGSNRDLYPNNDYYKMMFKPWAMMQRVGLSMTSGSDKIRIFSNVNFMNQGGQFITDQNTFKTGQIKYNSLAGSNYLFNCRTNLDFTFNSFLTGFIRLNGQITKENSAGQSNDLIYSGLFYLPPTMYGPYTPIVTDPLNVSKTIGGEVLSNYYVNTPSYGLLNRSGFGRFTGTDVIAQTGLNLNMDFLTKGLMLSGRFAYQTSSTGTQYATQNYELWLRNNDPNQLGFVQSGLGTWQNSPLVYSKTALFSYNISGNVQMNYQKKIGNNSVDAMAYADYQNYVSPRTDGAYMLPYNRVNTGITFAWGYDNKYFLKGDIGYSGSEQFARGKRFTLTPSIAAAWVITDEEFLSDLSWLSNLKLRSSIGQSANDQLGDARFLYADNILNGGARYIENLNYMITENQIGNPNLAAEKSIKQNYGIDLGLFNNISVTFDYFRSYTDNMLISAIDITPSFTGLTPGIFPKTNEGKMENQGFEIGLNYFKILNNDISIFMNGSFSFAKNTVIDVAESPKGEGYAYQYRKNGYSLGQQFGYLIDYSKNDGYFNSQDDANKMYYSFATPRAGDFRYKNLNGDKTADGKEIIDEKDLAPVGSSVIPRIYYGFTIGGSFQSFEISCLLQGIGVSSRQFNNVIGFDETQYGGIYSDIHIQSWTTERAASGAAITFPALSQHTSASSQPNDFNTKSTAYLRIKNFEFAYSLPQSVIKHINAKQVRLAISAQNLFTWDTLKTKCIDPEISSLDQFQNYKVFNIGLKVSF